MKMDPAWKKLLTKSMFRTEPHIDIDVTSLDLELLFNRISTEWSQIGARDPHWSVYSQPEFHIETFNNHKDKFYESGVTSASLIKKFADRNKVEIDYSHVIELGCGTGRVTVRLADLFNKVTAIDISPHHLRLCGDILQERSKNNVDLLQVTSLLTFNELPSCSFFYTVIVLQHNPPPLTNYILDCLLSKVQPGGAALFQVPTQPHKPDYEFKIADYLSKGMPKDYEMHIFPMNRIFQLLKKHGFDIHEVAADSFTGNIGSYTFFASKPQNKGTTL